MKKVLSLFLALVMILSSFSVAVFAADSSVLDNISNSVDFYRTIELPKYSDFNGYEYANGKVLENGGDIEALVADGSINDANLFGFSVDLVYNNKDTLMWNTIAVKKTDENANEYYANQSSDFALLKAYINRYLGEKFVEQFGEENSLELYTRENVVILSNFIGNIINPNYCNITTKDISVAYTTDKDFYTAVVTISGLRDAVDSFWCQNYSVNYIPFLTLLGFDFDDEDMLGESKLRNADRVSRTLVRSIIKRMVQKGPLEYILEVISKGSRLYSTSYCEAVTALLSLQISGGITSAQQLKTVDGVVNLIANKNNVADTSNLQFFTAPTYRFGMTTTTTSTDEVTNTTETFMYLLLYLNLIGKWTERTVVTDYASNTTATLPVGNKEIVESLIANTSDSGLKTIYKALFCADFTNIHAFLDEETEKHAEEVTNPDSIKNIFKKFLARILDAIADIFEKLYNSFNNFGDF